ncbi:competence type IV pilus assembly protein ComGB [Lysinibacillus mangiferihumi]|uniref:competence type IV pilus assembly protein ComGB n=1 Tax=Lysinibacillus mangiferihumi TaxID=1130819 RepID=UPI001F445B41|nr:competence type IV pilus assembly protein ComGB [Lysinibacillus mangiferihumi]
MLQLRAFIDKLQLDYKRTTKWRLKEQAQFIRRLSVLIQEGYLFAQAVSMLLPHHVKNHEEVQQFVDEALKQGKGVIGVFDTLQLAKHYLVAISIAEHNGHLVEALGGVAKQMALSQETKKKLIKLLLYPVVLIVFLLLLFLLFRTFFFPNIEAMVTSRNDYATEEQSSIAVSKLLLHVPDVFIVVFFVLTLASIIFQRMLKRLSVARQLQIMLKTPFVNSYFRLTITKQFSAYLGSLLHSGFSLQASLQILERQRYQPNVRFLASRIKERVTFGDTLTQAVSLLPVWQNDFATFVEHGEQSGYLGKELVLYSELLLEKQELLLQRLLAFVQPTFFVFIALCIVAAYVSLLLPIYHMIELI